MKNHQGELTPQSKLLGRNAALALLELPLKDVHFTWLKSKWEGELKWNSRKAFKGYAPELIESLAAYLAASASMPACHTT